MIVNKVLGNLQDIEANGRSIEKIELEWFEKDKRCLRKVTDQGTEVGIVLDGAQHLGQGDILYTDDNRIIVIELREADVIVLEPRTFGEMAQVCYQLGNRHASVFLDGDKVMVPYDPTIVALFSKLEIPMIKAKRRLKYALQPAVHHH